MAGSHCEGPPREVWLGGTRGPVSPGAGDGHTKLAPGPDFLPQTGELPGPGARGGRQCSGSWGLPCPGGWAAHSHGLVPLEATSAHGRGSGGATENACSAPARGPRADGPSHGLPEAPGARTLGAHTGQGRVGLLEGMRDRLTCQVPVSRSGDSLAGQRGQGWGGRTLKEP